MEKYANLKIGKGVEMKQEKKKKISVTNIFIILCTIIYIFDRYIIPEPNGIIYSNPNLTDIIIGHSHGKLTLLFGILGRNYISNGFSLYRYFTVCLVHDNLLHIIVNMLGLYIAGNFVEEKIGKIKTALIFSIIVLLVSFTTSPLFFWSIFVPKEVIADFESAQICVGASGGIFGLMGLMLCLCTINPQYFIEVNKIKKITLGVYGFFFTWIASGINSWTTYAHNLGFLYGFIIGIILWLVSGKKNIKINKSKTMNQKSIIALELFVLSNVLSIVIPLGPKPFDIVHMLISTISQVLLFIVAIVMCNLALKEIKITGERGKKITKVVLILSIIGIFVGIITSFIM